MKNHIRRRDFITLLGGAAAAWPLAARAQQPAMPVVGWLDTTAASTANRVSAFRRGLGVAGFVEGRTVAIEFHFAGDHLDRLPALAADLVRRQVAAIVVNNPVAMLAAKAETSTIPIIFVSGADPVEAGMVTSVNRPNGNVTGVSFTTNALNPKRLELLHELVPKHTVIALLRWDQPYRVAQLRDMEIAARALGRQMLIVRAEIESEIDAAFATIVQAGVGALFVDTGPFFFSRRQQIVALAARHSLPASYSLREFVASGGLMSYGTSDTDAYRRGGLYVGRILKGEKPADLPVELPTRYELVFNLATAKALKLDIPPKLLALADELIE